MTTTARVLAAATLAGSLALPVLGQPAAAAPAARPDHAPVAAAQVSPAALPPAGLPRAATATARVRVALKPAWRVTSPSQLVLVDGVMACRVVRLVRSGSRPATAADVSCTVAAAAAARGPYPLVVTVKGVRGARVATRVSFTSGGASGGRLTGPLRQVDLSTSGTGSDAGNTPVAAMSPDGQYVAFWSDATNLYPGATDGHFHVYISDTATGRVVTIADMTKDGLLSDDASSTVGARALAWHPGSRRLLFGSAATNLGPTPPAAPVNAPYLYEVDLTSRAMTVFPIGGVHQVQYSPSGLEILFATGMNYGTDQNNDWDLWWFDTSKPETIYPVSTTADGQLPVSNGGPTGSFRPVWSPDGTKAAFESDAPLVPEDTNRVSDIYVKDLVSGAVARVSTSARGGQANGGSHNPAWSPTGDRIAFDSDADNLVPGDGNSVTDVFVKTLSGGAVQWVSAKASGEYALFRHRAPKWAPDGNRIAFTSLAVDLIPGFIDTNKRDDVYIKNLRTGALQLASVRADGRQGGGDSSQFSIYGPLTAAWTANGRGLLFHSRATNFSAVDNNAFNEDLFLKLL